MRSSWDSSPMASLTRPFVAERQGERGSRAFGVLLVGDEGLVVAEGDRGGDDAQVVDEPEPVLVRATDGERDDSTEPAGQLGGGGFVLVVAGQVPGR